VRGFRLRVGTDGSRVYSVGYFAGGRWKRYTIGRVGDLMLAGARVFVVPNPSGLNASFPGFQDKLIWFERLREFVAESSETPA